MDALSPLLDLAHLRVTLDVRCLLGGRFTIDHPALPPGEALASLWPLALIALATLSLATFFVRGRLQ